MHNDKSRTVTRGAFPPLRLSTRSSGTEQNQKQLKAQKYDQNRTAVQYKHRLIIMDSRPAQMQSLKNVHQCSLKVMSF